MHLPNAEADMLLITDSCKLFQQYLLCSMTSPQYARAWQTSLEWNWLCSGFLQQNVLDLTTISFINAISRPITEKITANFFNIRNGQTTQDFKCIEVYV